MSVPVIVSRVLDTLLPPICPITGAEVGAAGALSPEAWGELAFIAAAGCRKCGREIAELAPGEEDFTCDTCRAFAHSWDRGRAAFRYEGSGRRLVLSLKHGDRLDLVPTLARWMRNAAGPLVDEADLIIPIPLHWSRLLARRYNQSAELARVIAAQAGKSRAYAPGVLVRRKRTPKQEGLDRAGRIANVGDAMAITRPGRRRLAGKRVLLVDDVMTTGATLDAAAQICLAGGAKAVDVIVSALVNFDRAPYVAASNPDEERIYETD
ncbi:ComF family protein [Rhodobacteraceae bacterium NNCM2]|nr:ComF family protein [Coraliihabitans acroporae]